MDSQLGSLASSGSLAGATLLVPLGSTEQHGPHLPLNTDTLIAEAVAMRAASRLDGVLVAPALPFGSSGEHQDFAGTISIGTPALEALLIELVRSASHTFDKVVFVNGHGGNYAAVVAAEGRLRSERHDVGAWFPRVPTGGDAHAGDTETSVMLALAPTLVDMAEAAEGNRAPVTELMAAMQDHGVSAVSANGVLGDPTTASAERGEALLAAWVDDLVNRLRTDESA